MTFLIIAILCSVTVGVLLKLFKRYDISFKQALFFNYVTAYVLGNLIFDPPAIGPEIREPWLMFVLLGFMLPAIFYFLNRSVQTQGLARTDVAQRLSLIIPLIASILAFSEIPTPFKGLGLFIGLAGVALILKKNNTEGSINKNLIYPVVVFVGFGVIDILFKLLSRLTTIPYTAALCEVFYYAMIASIWFIIPIDGKWRSMLSWRGAIAGIILGAFNFSNILFYLKAHRYFSETPSTVFAGMNLGVIILGSLIGILAFKEKFSRVNYLGMTLAAIAVALIAIAQRYAI